MVKQSGKKKIDSRAPARTRAPVGRGEPRDDDGASWGSWAVGFVAVAAVTAGVFGWSAGCKHEPPPGAVSPSAPQPVTGRRQAPRDAGSNGVAAPTVDLAKPYDGPLIGSLVMQAPIYVGMEAYRDKRIGYIRHGGKAPVDPTPIKSANCDAGWYHLLAGGYVCGKFVTLDLNNPQVRLGITPPNLDDILPYHYAWNTAMGTPLYKSVPSREDMAQYEPYLKAQAKRRTQGESEAELPVENPYAASAAPAAADGGAPIADEKKPWWQADYDGGKPDIKLSDLTQDSDALVAKRMFKGFYIAIDRQFSWNNRSWYKTTAALVTPADRFAMNKPPTLQGIELPEGDPKNGAGFVLSTKALKYAVDPDNHQVAPQGPVDRFTAVRFTSRATKVGASVYRETSEGWWMRMGDGTYTDPGAPPAGLSPGEKWIDVNLSRQTLMAFEGDTPVYASLVSSGKKAKDPTDKIHDHQTIIGSFRVREKHISITMDGDGPAPGDMPYSIEDVPYVMYFEGSYALHAAFWHGNFGHEQSHGCVNLAPLDAKHLFFWTDPPLPQGWHGVITNKEKQGTRVVVHE